MKAQETVMSMVQLKELYSEWENLPARGTPNFIDYSQQRQAEISFKAGFNQALNTVVATQQYDWGEQAGKKEVVESVIYTDITGEMQIKELLSMHETGQAKLKEWGIEVKKC